LYTSLSITIETTREVEVYKKIINIQTSKTSGRGAIIGPIAAPKPANCCRCSSTSPLSTLRPPSLASVCHYSQFVRIVPPLHFSSMITAGKSSVLTTVWTYRRNWYRDENLRRAIPEHMVLIVQLPFCFSFSFLTFSFSDHFSSRIQ
jgi:hypothetical protein